MDARVHDAQFVLGVILVVDELAGDLPAIALLQDIACGVGAVALDIDADVADVGALVAAVVDEGCDGANGELSVFVPAYLGGAQFGDVNVKFSLAVHVANVGHIHDLAYLDGRGVEGAQETSGVVVDGEAEIENAGLGVESAPEGLASLCHAEVTLVTDVAKLAQLVHHEFLHNELIDDFLGHTLLGAQLGDVEVDNGLLSSAQVGDAALGVETEAIVAGGDLYEWKFYLLGCAVEACVELQG